MSRKALITGITGQDGSYLTELLLSKDYEVHGIIRRASSFNTDRIDHLFEDPTIGNKNSAIGIKRVKNEVKYAIYWKWFV